MFAVQEEEAFIVFLVFAAGLVALRMILTQKTKQQRLATIQKALEANSIDPQVRQALIDSLTADARRMNQVWQSVVQQIGRWLRTGVFVGGWLTFVIGGLILLLNFLRGSWHQYSMEPAMVATAVGFALVTLPVAMAELDRNRAARAQR